MPPKAKKKSKAASKRPLKPGSDARALVAQSRQLLEDLAKRLLELEVRLEAMDRPSPAASDSALAYSAEAAASAAKAGRAMPDKATREASDFLSKVPFLARLSARECTLLAQRCATRQLAAGSMLFSEGEPGEEMFVLEDGHLEIFKKDFLGDLRLAEIRAGGIVGEMALIEGKPRSANVRAMQDCKVLALNRANYELLKDEHPQVATKLQDELLRLFSNRLRQTTEKMMGRI